MLLINLIFSFGLVSCSTETKSRLNAKSESSQVAITEVVAITRIAISFTLIDAGFLSAELDIFFFRIIRQALFFIKNTLS